MKKELSLLCMAMLLFCCACKDKIKPGNVEPERKKISGVVVRTVTPSEVDSFYETSGTVKAKNVSIISSRLMGTVRKIVAKEGDRVKAGDVLLFIDDSDVAQRMAAAEAGYREAQKALEASRNRRSLADVTWQRYSKLLEEKVISKQEFDQIETQKKVADNEYERAQLAVERARAVREEARVYYGFTKIKAPYAGLVTAKKIDEGSMASPGVPLFIVEDTSQFKIEVAVDERLYKDLAVGTEVEVFMDSINDRRRGAISKIAPAVNPSTRTFNIEVLMKDAPLRTGIFGKVFIPEGKREAILVPGKAVVEKGQLTGVYSVDGKGVVSYHLIKTGKSRGEQIEVLSGLQSGDRIITEGVEKAVDGGIIKQ